ncbi:bifunctional lysylphosphatidylglycerol flippase/synthetase MprF [Paenarthrobacter nitroguajacolicus]|uniref:bifunctional lysylphosphatidylglycerol flippase/synthetase MprF n=1 Tax=Paenarthrobacter nitroguajacolicus TaxID=211146 RepID=UPI003ADF39E3
MPKNAPGSAEPQRQFRSPWRALGLGAPITPAFIVVFWAMGAVWSVPGSGPARFHLAATAGSLPGQWWALLTSAFWARDVTGYVLGSVLLLLAGMALERRMGSLRYAAAALGTQLLGTAAAIGFTAVTRDLTGNWAREMDGHLFMGPSAMICGAAMAATAGMGTLWRRRIRLIVFAMLMLLALYTGGFADLVRLGAAAAGAIVGPVLLGRRPHPGVQAASRHEGRVLLALLVAVSAIGPVVAGLVPHAVGPLSLLRFLFTNIQPVDPQTLQSLCADPTQVKDCTAAQLQLRAGAGGIFMAILPSFLLLLLADGLRRGRRFAWAAVLLIQAALSVLAGATMVGVLMPAAPDTAAAERIGALDAALYGNPLSLALPLLLPMLVSAVLLSGRKLFPVTAPPGTYRRLALVILATAVVLGVVYLGAGLALAGGFSPVPGLAELLADVPDRFMPLGYMIDLPPAFVPQSTATVVLYEGTGIIFWTIAGALILKTFLRPAHSRHRTDEDRARSILTTSDSSTLSWMTSWSGNTYWFSPSGESFIAYRVIAGIALTLGGPVGPKSATKSSFTEFSRYCIANGWTACFYSVPRELSDQALALGWSCVQIAQETVLELEAVSFKGKKFQDIRTAMNNAARAGVRAEWTSYPAAAFTVQAQIQAIAEEWVADRKMPEMGFTLGGLDELNDPEVRCLLAVDSNDTVHAVTSWLPVYRNGHVVGWTLDFMRSRGTAFRASIEFLIASAALHLKNEGYEFISLSGAPLARAPQHHQTRSPTSLKGTPDAIDRLLDWLGASLEPVYGFRSLLSFKAKFQPRFEPLYLLYPDAAALPSIGNAIARAYLPDVRIGQGLSLARTLLRRTLSRPGPPPREPRQPHKS